MRRIGGLPLRSVAAVAAALLAGVAAAEAAPRVCRQLEAELASGGGGGEARRYERAMAGQRQQLEVARSRAREAGCGFFGIFKRSCGPLNSQIDRMEENIASLERARSSASAVPRRSRSAIMAALDANGCRDKPVEVRDSPSPRQLEPDEDAAQLFRQLFGGGDEQGDAPDASEQASNNGPDNVVRILNPSGQAEVYGPTGSFATMCVRTCDGYFFPVSPNSSAGDFERDQKNCEATCPGTEVQLYYRAADSDDTDAMTSIADGSPYMSLPNAYVYKDSSKPRIAACGCKGAMVDPNFSVVGGETEPETAPAEPAIPTPSGRPDPALDPETTANLEGGLDVETIRRILKPKPAIVTLPPPGERKVRVVGPVFLPDPDKGIDLKKPSGINR
jgi:Protein of unknown function (DUF2865)